MADAFNLTAQLNLRGPNNIKTVVADIRRQLGTVNANLNFRIDPTASNNLARLNGTLRAFNSTLGQTQTSANNAAQAISNLGRAVNSVNVRNLPQQVNASASAISKMSSSAATTTKTVQQTATAVEELGKQSYLAVKRFAAFSIPTAAVFALTNAVNKGVAAFIEYDKQFVKLQQITGESAGGLENLSKTITGLATGLGVASSDITNVASTLAQAGLSARDTERALKALALSNLAPSFDSMNETVEGSIALMRQFGINAGDLEKALGSVNAVAAKFAVEASDIITAIQRTGGVFATASKGVSEGTDALNEFIAVFTSVRATTRESAETIATGLRTIFTRIQRGSTIDALKEFGVNLQDAEGKFVGAYKAVELLSKGLSKIDPRDLRFSQIVEELGGFRQIGKVIPLIQQFATAQDALKVAQKGQGSLAADAAKAQESLANKITKVKEEFFALFREIGSSQGFQTIIRGALDLSSALIKVADSIKGILPALTIFAAFKGVSALTQFGTGFIGAARTRQKADGGPVYRFQSGGVVPGSGKGDKVRALLEPGEVVINNAAANSYGRENLLRMNRYASGGRIKSLLQAKPDLNRYYDTDDQKDKYTNISIKRPSQNTSFKKTREQYRDQAQSIWQGASNIFVKTNDLSAANAYIKNKTRINPGAYDADELNPKNQSPRRFNRIQGALTEKTVRGQTRGLRKLPNAAGADFVYSDSSNNFIEVKNKLDRTSDDDLYAKALLGYAYISGKGPTYFKNNKLDNISGLSIELRSTNLLDIQKRNLGGIIQKFMSGDIVKSILSNVPTEPSPASLIQGPFPAKSAEYKKWKQQLSEIAAGFGIPYDGTNIRVNGVSIPLGDALSSRKLTAKNFQQKVGIGNIPKLESLRKRILETYSRGQSDVAVADPFNLTDDEKSKAMRVAIVGLQSQYTEQYRQFFKKVGGRPLSVHVGALASDKAILDRMRQRDIASLDQGASELLPGAIPKKLTDKELDDLGRPNAEGYQLEVLLAKLGAVGGKSTNRGRAVDFEGGLPPNLAKLFGVPSGIFTQAKRTLSSDSVGDALEGIAARLAGVRMAFGGQVNGPSFEDIKKQILDKYPEIEFRISKRKTGRGFGYNLLGALRTDGGLLKSKGLKFQQPSNLQKLLEASDGMARDLLDGGSTRKFSSGGTVPAMVSNGEAFVPPEIAKRIGYSKLHQMNRADSNNMKGFSSGGISIFKGPGSGTSDSIGPIGLPEGSFILREKATKALGLSKGGSVHNFAKGGKTDQIYTNNINRSADISISKGNPLQGINLFFGSIEKLTNKLPASSGLIKNLDQTLGNLGQTFSNIRTQSRVTIQQLRNAIETDLRKAQAANLSTVSIDKLKKALQTLNDVSTTASSKLQDIRSARQYDRFTVAGTYVKNAFGNTLGSIPGSGAVSGFGKGLGGIVSRIGAGVGGQAGFMTSMALGMLAGQGENIFGKENGKRNNTGFSSRIGANNALTAAGLEAGSTTLSAGIATASSLAMIPVVGPFAAGLTVAVTAVKAWTNAVEAGKQAAENFATAQRQKNIDDASDKLGKSLEQFQKNPSDVTSQSNVIRNAASVSRQIADKSEADIRIARRQKIGSRTWSQWWNNETPQLGVDEMRSISDANAKAAQPAADAARGVIEARIESGSTLSDMANMPDFKSLAETIASANPEFAAARDRIRAMSEETVRATGKTKDQMVAEALHTEIVKLSNDPYLKSKEASMLAAKAMDDVNKAGRKLAMSFDKLANDFNQALNKTMFDIEAADRISQNRMDMANGNARITSAPNRDINVLQNPNAYTAQDREIAQSRAASYFGKDAEAVKGMLKLDATDFAAKITQSLDENVLKNNASADLDSAASEARKVLNAQLKDAPENVRTQLLGELEAIQKTIDANPNFKSPKDKVNAFNEEVGKKLGQESLEAAKNIKEMAIRVLEFKNGALNKYIESVNVAAEAQLEFQKIRFNAQDTIRSSGDTLRQTLGFGNVSVAEIQARRNQRLADFTRSPDNPNGVTDILSIRQNIDRDKLLLEDRQKKLNEASQDPKRANDVINLGNEISTLSNKIKNGQSALDDFANSTDVASAALNEIQRIQQAMQGQGEFLDRLASSTPEDVDKLGQSFQRLINNLNGNFNPINNRDAQRAYNDVIMNQGGNHYDAMRASQGVLAQQRGETLALFKELIPVLQAQGRTEQEIAEMYARVRTGIYGESGMMRNPMLAALANSQIGFTRDPRNDPRIMGLSNIYMQDARERADAMVLRGSEKLDAAATNMAEAAQKFLKATEIFARNFATTRANNPDPDREINPPAVPGVARSKGGIIYANKGKLINFQPQGSDTVPAMLTPGEFVVNAKSTAQNLPLLKSINEGTTRGYRSGGMVYLKDGDIVKPKKDSLYKKVTKTLNKIPLPDYITGSSPLPFPNYPESWNNTFPMESVTASLHPHWRSIHEATTVGPSFRNVYGNTNNLSDSERTQINNYANFIASRSFRRETQLPDYPYYKDLSPSTKQKILTARNERNLIENREEVADRFNREQDYIRHQRRIIRDQNEYSSHVLWEQQQQRQKEADRIKNNPKYAGTPWSWLDRAREHNAQVAVTGNWSAPRASDPEPVISRPIRSEVEPPVQSAEELEVLNRGRAIISRARAARAARATNKSNGGIIYLAQGGGVGPRHSLVEKIKKQIAEREARDNAARSQINPLTGKPYLDAAEKAGVEAKARFEGKPVEALATTATKEKKNVVKLEEEPSVSLRQRLEARIAGTQTTLRQLERDKKERQSSPFRSFSRLFGDNAEDLQYEQSQQELSLLQAQLDKLRSKPGNYAIAREVEDSFSGRKVNGEYRGGINRSIASSRGSTTREYRPGMLWGGETINERDSDIALRNANQGIDVTKDIALSAATSFIPTGAIAGVGSRIIGQTATRFATRQLVRLGGRQGARAGIAAGRMAIEGVGGAAVPSLATMAYQGLGGNSNPNDRVTASDMATEALIGAGSSVAVGGGLRILGSIVGRFLPKNTKARGTGPLRTPTRSQATINSPRQVVSQTPVLGPNSSVDDTIWQQVVEYVEQNNINRSSVTTGNPSKAASRSPIAPISEQASIPNRTLTPAHGVATIKTLGILPGRISLTGDVKQFFYEAVDATGKAFNGIVRATNEQEAMRFIKNAGLRGLQLTEKVMNTRGRGGAGKQPRLPTFSPVNRSVGGLIYMNSGGLISNEQEDLISDILDSSNPSFVYKKVLELGLSRLEAAKIAGFKTSNKSVSNKYIKEQLLNLLNKKYNFAKIKNQKSYGGIIYADRGAFISAATKGSDSVPAMLSPGEFVVNRDSAQKHMPTLHAINKGYYNGGVVKYFNDGGSVGDKSPKDNVYNISSDTGNYIVGKTNYILDYLRKIDPNTKQTLDYSKKTNDSVPNLLSKKDFDKKVVGTVGKAQGGMIYASEGKLVNFQPKGTDTVPAMLTPGEFVVNAKSTAQHLPLLKAINSGHMSDGGVVYAENGLLVPSEFDKLLKKIKTKPESFPSYSSKPSAPELRASGPGGFSESHQVPNESFWTGSFLPRQLQASPTRKETKYEKQLRLANSLHPNTDPSLGGAFYPNMKAALDILGNIGEAKIVGGLRANQPRKFGSILSRLFKSRTRQSQTSNYLGDFAPELGNRTSPAGELLYKLGYGLQSPKQELLEVLLAAKQQKEDSGKPAALLDHSTFDEIVAQRPRLLGMMKELKDKGLIDTRSTKFGSMLVGKSSHVKELQALFDSPNRDHDSHDRIGQLLGYGIDARTVFDMLSVSDSRSKLEHLYKHMEGPAHWIEQQIQNGRTMRDIREQLESIIQPRSSATSTLRKFLESSATKFDARGARKIGEILSDTQLMKNLELVFKQQSIDISRLKPLGSGLESLAFSYGKDVIKISGNIDKRTTPLQNPIISETPIPGHYLKIIREAKLVTEGVTLKHAQNMIDRAFYEHGMTWMDAGTRQMGFHPETGEPLVFDGSFVPANPHQKKPRTLEPETNHKLIPPPPPPPPARYQNGGIIYASTGKLINFEPKGTDTVPAMLTPGEFVVNAKATAKHLPLLKSINDGDNPKGYNSGGVVYLANGGRASGLLNISRNNQLSREQMRLNNIAPDNAWVVTDLLKQDAIKLPNVNKYSFAEWQKASYVLANGKREALSKIDLLNQNGNPEAKAFIDNRAQLDLISGKHINQRNHRDARSNIRDIKTTTASDPAADVKTILREVDFQRQIPNISDFNPSDKNDNNAVTNKANEILNLVKPIAEGGKGADPQLIKQKARLRKDYLIETMKNQEEALGILAPWEAVQGDLGNRIREASDWLKNTQQVGSQKELDFIEAVWAKIDQLKPEYANVQIVRGITGFNQVVPKFNKGGIVYANNGALINAKNKGSDTVPAMLSPGEFVVNRNMAQKHMPVLQAINKGYYNQGGLIQYLNNGGVVGPKYYQNGGAINSVPSGRVSNGVNNTVSSTAPEWLSTLDEKVNKISSSLKESLNGMFSNLNNVANQLNTAAQELPREMSITSNINKNVNVNGISGEWNKHQADILKMAGEQSSEQYQNKQIALSKWSEGAIPPIV